MVDSFQLFFEQGFDGRDVLERDGTLQEEPVVHLAVDNLVHQSVDAFLGVFLEAV